MVALRRRPACRARLEPARPCGRLSAAATAAAPVLPDERDALRDADAAKPYCRRPNLCSCGKRGSSIRWI